MSEIRELLEAISGAKSYDQGMADGIALVEFGLRVLPELSRAMTSSGRMPDGVTVEQADAVYAMIPAVLAMIERTTAEIKESLPPPTKGMFEHMERGATAKIAQEWAGGEAGS